MFLPGLAGCLGNGRLVIEGDKDLFQSCFGKYSTVFKTGTPCGNENGTPGVGGVLNLALPKGILRVDFFNWRF